MIVVIHFLQKINMYVRYIMFMVHVKRVLHGETLPYVRQLVTGLLPWRLGFHSNLVLMGFVVYIMLLEKVVLGVLWFFLVIIIPSMLHMH